MEFQEIDFDLNFGKVPFEIGVIFKYSFWEGKLYNRYQKIEGENFISFAPYVDYWNFIEDWKKDLVFGENGRSIDDISPYYEAYSKGFMYGYFEFENEIKEVNQIFNQNSFPVENIFDETKSGVLPFATRGYFYKNDNWKETPLNIIKKDLLYRDGVKIGRNYKAWFYIIKNPKPFIQLFKDFYSGTYPYYEDDFKKRNSHIQGYSSPLQIVINEIQGKKSISESEKDKEKNQNTFNRMPFEEVKSHFEKLTTKQNPSGEIWITKQDFETFLNRSFRGQTDLPKPKINIGPDGKFAIVKLFHGFFDISRNHPYNEPNKKDRVLNLLKNAFQNPDFENLRADNFKADKSKYPWD